MVHYLIRASGILRKIVNAWKALAQASLKNRGGIAGKQEHDDLALWLCWDRKVSDCSYNGPPPQGPGAVEIGRNIFL
jgi:hypothetical protein